MSDDRDVRAFIDVVETWNVLKLRTGKFNQRDMREYVSQCNVSTRKLIHFLGVQDPNFYTGLAELATQAATDLDAKARFIVDGADGKRM